MSALPPPPANLYESNGGVMFRLGVAMTILPTLSIFLRVWARLHEKKFALWWDDWLAIMAWLCTMACCAFTFIGVNLGFGRHIQTVTDPNDIVQMLRILYLAETFFDAGISFCKFSALCFYLRIFTVQSKRFKWTYWSTFWLTFAYAVYRVGVQIGSCSPPQKFWHPEISGSCVNGYSNLGVLVSGTLWDVITDFLILVLPMPVISGLHMSRAKRSVIIVTFFCGYIAWILSFGRMGASIAARPHLDTIDFTWNLPSVLEWSLAELAISVFSICIPIWFYMLRRSSEMLSDLFTSPSQAGTSLKRLFSRETLAQNPSDDRRPDEEQGTRSQAARIKPQESYESFLAVPSPALEKDRVVGVRTDVSVEQEDRDTRRGLSGQPWSTGEAHGLDDRTRPPHRL